MSVAPGKQVVCEGDVCRIVDSKGADAKAAPEGVSTGSSAITALLGQTLLSQGAPISTNSVSGTGKYLGLYFSAHWCPPCRGFTPRLAKFYENFKKSHAEASNFDVVFVSSDRSADDFASYYAEMPWKALPYEDRETKQKLSAKFKVSGIPTFIILDADTGAVIASDGRSKVESDPEGAEFPWRPPSLASLLEGPAVNAKGESKAISELVKDKITAIYFSAHWCPPCRQFTPMLAEFYKSLQATGTAFEVLFVSSDRSEEQFREYLGEMPWWALPYGDSKRRAALSSRFDVEGIPTLIILSEGAAKVITTEGTSCLRSDPDGADFPWAPKPVEKLTPTAIPRLNDGETCYILFTDDSSAAGVQRAEELLIDSALPEFTKEDPGAFFYVADAAAKLSRSVLGMLKLESAPLPALAMLALPKYAVAPAAGSAADVQSFVAACNAGSVALQSLESA